MHISTAGDAAIK